MPLLDFYKTEVYQIARELNLPEEIISQPPSPDLIPGLGDELILGMDYQTIDRILMTVYHFINKGYQGIRISESGGFLRNSSY